MNDYSEYFDNDNVVDDGSSSKESSLPKRKKKKSTPQKRKAKRSRSQTSDDLISKIDDAIEQTDQEEQKIIKSKDNNVVVLLDKNDDDRQAGEVYGEILNKLSRISRLESSPIVYNAAPCRLVDGQLQQLKKDTFGQMMASRINFYGKNNDRSAPVGKVPDHVITGCYNHEDFGSIFPTVHRVTSAPILGPDSTFIGEGYISDLNIYQLPGIDFIPVDSLEESVEILTKPFSEFDFVDEQSRANAWAYFFTMLMQPFIDGNVPFFLFSSPKAGAGKGLLCKSLHQIVEGTDPKKLLWPRGNNWNSQEAINRRIISALIKAAPVYQIDNLTTGSVLDSDTLSIISTEGSIEGKILYHTAEKTMKVNSIFTFTGNNITVSDDLLRRVHQIHLDPNHSNPESRTFSIDLKQYITENRQLLLSAAASIIDFWYSASSPECEQIKGSFEEWIAIIGGIIEFAGLGSFSSAGVAERQEDPWLIFIQKVFAQFGENKWRTNQVVNIAFGDNEDGPLFEMKDEIVQSDTKWLGKKIAIARDNVFTINSKTSVKLVKSKDKLTKHCLKVI